MNGIATAPVPGFRSTRYFETVRKARAVVKIPPDFVELDKPIMVKPDDVVEAFVKANPGLSRADLAVACDSKRLSEVRVCLNKDFSFRDCAEVTRRACKRDSHRDAGDARRMKRGQIRAKIRTMSLRSH